MCVLVDYVCFISRYWICRSHGYVSSVLSPGIGYVVVMDTYLLFYFHVLDMP